jgi:hypothetical protein
MQWYAGSSQNVIWRIVHMAFNISPPKNITNLFGNWLMGVNKKERAQT